MYHLWREPYTLYAGVGQVDFFFWNVGQVDYGREKLKETSNKNLPCSTGWWWRLVLEYCEKKLLLAGWCWRLMLECCETKLLLAGAGTEQQNRWLNSCERRRHTVQAVPHVTSSAWDPSVNGRKGRLGYGHKGERTCASYLASDASPTFEGLQGALPANSLMRDACSFNDVAHDLWCLFRFAGYIAGALRIRTLVNVLFVWVKWGKHFL